MTIKLDRGTAPLTFLMRTTVTFYSVWSSVVMGVL